MNHEFLAVGMTLIAGLSTGIGGLITYFSRKPNARFLSISLGFSAGVMLYVSMVELFAQSKETLSVALGGSGYPIAVLSFFGGMLAIAVIDRLVPEYENPHEMTYLDGAGEDELAANSGKMMRHGPDYSACHHHPQLPRGYGDLCIGASGGGAGASHHHGHRHPQYP